MIFSKSLKLNIEAIYCLKMLPLETDQVLVTSGRHGGAGVQPAAGGDVVSLALVGLQLLQQDARLARTVARVGHQTSGLLPFLLEQSAKSVCCSLTR